jgi:hypothetical protein
MSEAVYVVQHSAVLQIQDDGGPGSRVEAWVDIATVTVPARTHRKTVIEKAIDQAAENEDVDLDLTAALTVRVLDAESARVTPVEMEQPPPRLKIG